MDIKWQVKKETYKTTVLRALQQLDLCCTMAGDYVSYSKLIPILKKYSGLGHEFDFLIVKCSYSNKWKVTISTWKQITRDYLFQFEIDSKDIPSIKKAIVTAFDRAMQWDETDDYEDLYARKIEKVFEEILDGSGTCEQFNARVTMAINAAREAVKNLKEAIK
jgi:hypothetical protein